MRRRKSKLARIGDEASRKAKKAAIAQAVAAADGDLRVVAESLGVTLGNLYSMARAVGTELVGGRR